MSRTSFSESQKNKNGRKNENENEYEKGEEEEEDEETEYEKRRNLEEEEEDDEVEESRDFAGIEERSSRNKFITSVKVETFIITWFVLRRFFISFICIELI